MKSGFVSAIKDIEKWPSWLRWALFLPTAIVGSFAANFFYFWVARLLLSSGESGVYIQIGSSGIFGLVFVYAGTWMVPKFKFETSIALLAIVSMFALLMIVDIWLHGHPVLGLLNGLAVLFAAGMTVINIKNEGHS